MRRLISSGSPFEAEAGYSRAVVDGEWVFVSGTTGFDYAAMTISDDVVEQAEQCFRNIIAALERADAQLADVVRVTYLLPDAALFRAARRCCAATWARCGPRPPCCRRGSPTRA